MPICQFRLAAQSVAQARDESIGVEAKNAAQGGVTGSAEEQVRSGHNDSALGISIAEVARQEELVERIGGEKQSEFDVVLLQLVDNPEHHRFLRKRCLSSRVGRDRILVIPIHLQIEDESRYTGRPGGSRLLPRGFLLISGTKIGNLSGEMQLENFLIERIETVRLRTILLVRRVRLAVRASGESGAVDGFIFRKHSDLAQLVAAIDGKLKEFVTSVLVILLEGREMRAGERAKLPLKPQDASRRGDGSTVNEVTGGDFRDVRLPQFVVERLQRTGEGRTQN